MYDFECPACEGECLIENEDLPDRACDDVEFECPHCNTEMRVGWYAEVEVRSVTVGNADIDA